MVKYTALDDPFVDQQIESHMQAIVDVVRSHMEPRAIILRGSFGRGEGSVLFENGVMKFLSDYEIDVVTQTPKYRNLFKKLSHQLTQDLNVETSLRWQQPNFMTRMRIGPVTTGKAIPTISLYELHCGARTLYGEDFFSGVKKIEPDEIDLKSGLLLLFNRMAESMMYMPDTHAQLQENIASYYWVNKTILACIEALLLVWGQYHYSYEERGKRFHSLAFERLKDFPDSGEKIVELAARATEFKLRPKPNLYTTTVKEAWEEIFPEVIRVSHLVFEGTSRISFENINSFPEKYLHYSTRDSARTPITEIAIRKLLELYRCSHNQVFPPALFSLRFLSDYVYAVIPVLFEAQFTEDCTSLLVQVRKYMASLGKMAKASEDVKEERAYLTKRLTWYWKVFCHG